jgi:hypothetical protein
LCGFDRFGDFSVVLRWLLIVSSTDSSLMVGLEPLSTAFAPLTAAATALVTASLATPSDVPLISEVSRSKRLLMNITSHTLVV